MHTETLSGIGHGTTLRVRLLKQAIGVRGAVRRDDKSIERSLLIKGVDEKFIRSDVHPHDLTGTTFDKHNTLAQADTEVIWQQLLTKISSAFHFCDSSGIPVTVW